MENEPLSRRQEQLSSPETLNARYYSFCLASDTYVSFPVQAGQRSQVLAYISATCDSRGWSPDNWIHQCGPTGVPGWYVNGSLGYPNAPIGMLIGAISPFDAGPSMSQAESQTIFTNNTLLIGGHYDVVSPLDGFLYLMFNDTWSWSDNKGSIGVEVTLF